MLSKDCKKLLDALIKDLDNQPYRGYDETELTHISGMSESNTVRVAEYLCAHEYMGVEVAIHPVLGKLAHYHITELGKNYQAEIRQRRMDYIKDKWTDVLASIISIIALIVSIVALSH